MLKWINNLNFQYGFLEAGCNFTQSLMEFYNFICVLLILISFLIGYWMLFILKNHTYKTDLLGNEKSNWDYMLEGKNNIKFFFNTQMGDRSFEYLSLADIKDYPILEGSWCIVPLSFVSTVSYPSIGLEYGISPDITPLVTLKVIAHQWYWIFELEAKASPGLIEGNDNFFCFNSDYYKLFVETYGDAEAFYKGLDALEYQVLEKKIEVNLNNNADPEFLRLLAIDNKIVLPINTPIKLIVTSVDVLHSFAMPAWGVKIDAIPGRLSEQIIMLDRPGVYFGQCSELCGPYHGFMPVVFEISNYPVFLTQFFEIGTIVNDENIIKNGK